MDPQTLLIGVAAFVISAILIYLISAFTMKEKTFEEVLEEQRRRQEEEREKQKSEKKAEKEHKKKYRKGKEKTKEKPDKPAPVQETDVQRDHKMVNLEIDPEIIEPVETVALNTKKSKNKKSKSILVNKEEKPLVTDGKQTKELYHKDMAPKDEVELHHEQRGKDKQHPEQQSKASKKQEKAREAERLEKERIIHVEKRTETMVEIQHTRAVMAESEVKSARAKGGVLAADGSPLNGSKLIASVKSANLKDSEIQTLIEILLNRQGISTSGAGAASATEWNKKSQKGDPTSLLRKQLEEKERALQEEQTIAMSASSRVKELRQDLSSEKAKFATLEKRYQEKLSLQEREIESLHARMQNTHQQHMRDSEALQSKVAQLETAGDRNVIQKLQEEKKILSETLAKTASEKTISPAEVNNLKQKVQIMEKELSSNAIKLNASENAKKSLEQKLAKFEDQLKKHDAGQKDSDVQMTRRMEEVSQELRRAEARNDTLVNDKKKANGELTKANDALNNAQQEVSTLKSKLQELEKHLSASDNQKELETKLQESERKKLDLEGNIKNLEKQLFVIQKQRAELESDMKSLQQENYALAEEMKTTKERQAGEGQEAPTAPAGAPNGDVHEKADGKQIEIREHEKILGEKLAEIGRLTTDIQSQKQQVSSLQEQLDAQKKKNNDEKSQAQVSEIEALDKGVLQRIFPDIAVNAKLVHNDWMGQFEREASTYITNISSKSSESAAQDSRVQELVSSNAKLQSQVSEYKQLVTDAETKLQQLEKSVESEEKRWKKELQEAQSNLKTSTSRVSELEQIMTKYKSEVTVIKKSLAETEKRLGEAESNSQLVNESRAESTAVEEKCRQFQERVGQLEESNSQYEKQVQEYRNVLALTEDKLSQLEQQAKSEESRWQDKITRTETDLQQSKKDVECLQEQVKKFRGSTEDLSDLSFAYGIVEKSLPRIIEEMEVKVESLESQLKASEERCLMLQKETEEAQTKVVTVQSQLEITKHSSDDLEALRRRIAELENFVEAEKKKTKELSMNVVKLNGIIKTGQDALRQEQGTVEKLTDQLNAAQSGGGGSGKGVKELRAKLADKEKHLEREILTNKQLSQQLAQLGVLAYHPKAASPGNDAGTSV
ncbi:ribosome-binding protein 1-like isoform X10 [Haliotis rufescens]|uniref:ribosome-binding protein 1-like isoform X10 n=1 Tax=Haliotis rufescens TaxID=6454 RepID=UPI001EB039BB|nr:ribosome-binding protein 1-like isoform X10 [Haliotis rufescens]